MNRRALFGGLLATLAAPAVIRTPGLLMPVRVVRPMFTLDDFAKMLEAQRLINQRHSAMLNAFPPSVPFPTGAFDNRNRFLERLGTAYA